MSRMRVLVFGAGAVGLYVGGRLAADQHSVTFIARPGNADALRAHGLCLRRGPSSQRVANIRVAASPAEALAVESFDFIVFALKSYDTATALTELRAATDSPPPILCLQNGVDNEPEIARAFDPASVIAGTVTTALSRAEPGQVVIERERGIGVALGQPLSARIADALAGAGLKTHTYPAAGPMKWSKLLANLVGNATSAILDLPAGEVFADPRLFALERAALRECLAVMRALGCAPVDLPGMPVRALALGAEGLPGFVARPLLRRAVSTGRGGKMPSIHMDLHSRRGQTEVRWLNGAVARHGAARGIRTPVNQGLTETLEALSAGRLDKEAFRRRPEALLRLINT